MGTYLSLRIHSVKCIDETGGWLAERVGNDEIWLCGYALDSSNSVNTIFPMSVYNNFDDGDVKRYDPPHIYQQFYISDTVAAQNFAVVFILAEIDTNSSVPLRNYINTTVHTARYNIKQYGTPIIPGSAQQISFWNKIRLSVHSATQKLAKALDDDIFPQVLSTVSFGNGVVDNPYPTSFQIRAHDGTYEVNYDWYVG